MFRRVNWPKIDNEPTFVNHAHKAQHLLTTDQKRFKDEQRAQAGVIIWHSPRRGQDFAYRLPHEVIELVKDLAMRIPFRPVSEGNPKGILVVLGQTPDQDLSLIHISEPTRPY